jgi:hypothetical protein
MATHPLFRVRYWRSYPWPLQLFLLLLMVMTLASLMSAVAFVLVPAITGHRVVETVSVTADSARSLVHAALWSQALVSAGLFLLPSLLFAYLSHPSAKTYLGLRGAGKSVQWPLVFGVMIGAAPVFLALEGISRKLLPATSEAQGANDRLTQAFLQTKSPAEMLGVLIVIALLPALGEELFFRGVLFRFVSKRSRSIWFPIVATAVFFAAIHYNPAGLFPIFLAGILLAGIYWLTGSLWCSILAHFINNALQVALTYAARNNAGLKAILEQDFLPIGVIIGGAILFALSFYLLWKNRTPLRDGWASDTALETGTAIGLDQ